MPCADGRLHWAFGAGVLACVGIHKELHMLCLVGVRMFCTDALYLT